MTSWYRKFLKILRIYYSLKALFIFFLKNVIILKSFSILLDWYCGCFPAIFQDTILKYFLKIIFDYFYLNFYIYWSKYSWIVIMFLFLIYWFFPRLGLNDLFEIRKRNLDLKNKLKKDIENLNEDKFKTNNNINDKKNIINIRKKISSKFKRNIKKFK